MIKPKQLKPGDKVAVVSLSKGLLGEPNMIHKFEIAKKRLKDDFGLELVAMPNALKGMEFVYKHPELRAKDLMDAFKDPSIAGIICATGGDDTIRLLPYIDYDVIKNNPKIFTGYSDTTANHLMLYKAGLVSFYGPTIMCDFGQYTKMFDYTAEAVNNIFFKDSAGLEIKSSPVWSDDFIPWGEENMDKQLKTRPEEHGYELLQGSGTVEGCLLGGCMEVLQISNGTIIWPSLDEWKDKILLLETSDEKPTPDQLKYFMRNFGAQGIFDVIKGILVGKPAGETYYEEYKDVIKKMLKENHAENLPVLYNINVGHAAPIGILPLGTKVKVDFNNKRIFLVESATEA